MAKLQGDILFTGSLGMLSAYRMKGVDSIIIRRKGGPSKEKIRRSPKFSITRKNNAEFGHCARMAAAMRYALQPLKKIADHNLVPPLTALCRKILLLDTAHKLGQRKVQLSRHPYLLEGYNLSRRDSFDSVLRSPLSYTADTQNCSVQIDVPAFIPGANLHLPGSFGCYRLVFSLFLLPDKPVSHTGQAVPTTYSDWTVPTRKGQPAQVYRLQIPNGKALPADSSLLIGVGIELGVDGKTAVKYAGVGKVLGVVSREFL